MKRLALERLEAWKKLKHRKPLLLDGARQTGKTHLITKIFGPSSFRTVHIFDFREERSLHRYFEATLEPYEIIRNLSLFRRRDIDLKQDLVFFDEVGECQAAIDSLKYFAQNMPELALVASGSNISLLESFPVGMVQIEHLFPLNFEEFLLASGEEDLIAAFQQQSRLLAVHEILWEKLRTYYFVGGMPEAVSYWFESARAGIGIQERVDRVSSIHRSLIDGYRRDFGKYAGKIHALHIESVFESIPRQLAQSVDDSVKRYLFKNVIAKKNRYLELSGPIDWLCKTKLATKNFVLDCQPKSPLKALLKPNLFKLFFFDVGLLGHMLELSYLEQLEQSLAFKGFIAENFVQCELIARGAAHTYSWSERNSEIEFIVKTKTGEMLPIEVKSGKRTRAKSLQAYRERYQPTRTLKLLGAAGGTDAVDMVWPLYYASFICDL